jgi:acetyl-CoA C-acetyltransferase
MRDVSIIGIGQTKVAEHWDRSLRHLAGEAVLAAMKDAGVGPAAVDALYVGNMLSGLLTGQEHLGALIADFVGLRGIEAVKVEAACAPKRRPAWRWPLMPIMNRSTGSHSSVSMPS